jgi:hypothetical protein
MSQNLGQNTASLVLEGIERGVISVPGQEKRVLKLPSEVDSHHDWHLITGVNVVRDKLILHFSNSERPTNLHVRLRDVVLTRAKLE